MENLKISSTNDEINIDNVPDGLKIVKIEGEKVKRLSDLSLHKEDLIFAKFSLESINNVPADQKFLREALWRTAIIYFIKCFGNGVRFKLQFKTIYKNEPKEAQISFEYFKKLRNKHLIHDENSYSQCKVGAILNNGNKSHKVEKIVCISAIAGTLEQNAYNSLFLLINKALDWIAVQFDENCKKLTLELEGESYKNLISRDSLSYSVPTIEEIGCERKL